MKKYYGLLFLALTFLIPEGQASTKGERPGSPDDFEEISTEKVVAEQALSKQQQRIRHTLNELKQTTEKYEKICSDLETLCKDALHIQIQGNTLNMKDSIPFKAKQKELTESRKQAEDLIASIRLIIQDFLRGREREDANWSLQIAERTLQAWRVYEHHKLEDGLPAVSLHHHHN